MDLLNMTKRAQEENFIFQPTIFRFGDLLAVWKLPTDAKFFINIYKIMPVRPKNTGTWCVNTTITGIGVIPCQIT